VRFNFKKVKRIKHTVHIIHGGEDLFIPVNNARHLQTVFPSATLDIIPQAGHVAPVETPQELIVLMKQYLP
jgi:pimeloyl-ACP methyl ester carboxylesterase